MDRKELMEELTNLSLQKKNYTRQLDINYFNFEKRTYFFNEIKKIEKQEREIKFKLELLKELNK